MANLAFIRYAVTFVVLSQCSGLVSQRNKPNFKPSVIFSDICRLAIMSITIMSCFEVPPSLSIEGAAPKLEYFKNVDDSNSGPKIYNEADIKLITTKLESISKSFDKMINRIEAATQNNNKNEAKNAMELVMTDLKVNMRQVARVATNGDIYVRRNKGAEANFDYNSGKFEYKLEAQLVEDTVSKLNQLYPLFQYRLN